MGRANCQWRNCHESVMQHIYDLCIEDEKFFQSLQKPMPKFNIFVPFYDEFEAYHSYQSLTRRANHASGPNIPIGTTTPQGIAASKPAGPRQQG